MTTEFIVSLVVGLAALVFALSAWRRQASAPMSNGSLAKEVERLTTMSADQRVIINALQQQGSEQWTRISAQENQLSLLKLENAQLKRLNEDQSAINRALQRQLSGLATDSLRTSEKLRTLLTKKLNETDLRAWASDLKIPFESLEGGTLPLLIISMLDTLERYGRLDEGLRELRQSRPDIDTGMRA
jgi:predicted RNase H-like nuclease (RuvC/YqgF family)